MPLLHTSPIAQVFPHPPQLRASVARSVHALPPMPIPRPMKVHVVSPFGHVQVPAAHSPPAAQALPHMPQLRASVCRFEQAPLQDVSPVTHAVEQVPAEQDSPRPHALPHAPQLAGLVSRSTQASPHAVVPAAHSHDPAVQLAPVPHVLSHEPQSKGSLVRSTHALLQFVSEPPHVIWQVPAEQTWPVVHAVPHAPQLAGSLCVSVQTPSQRSPPL